MDPNEALRILRETVSTWRQDHHGYINEEDLAEEMVNSFEALDEWIAKGGFLPKDWEKGNPQ